MKRIGALLSLCLLFYCLVSGPAPVQAFLNQPVGNRYHHQHHHGPPPLPRLCRPAVLQRFASSSPSSSLSVDQLVRAAEEELVVLDLTSWGVISVKGDDRLSFLHNQFTNKFKGVSPGTILEASYTTPTGRTQDLITTIALDDEVLLLTSPNRRDFVFNNFNKYIFPLDRVTVQDKTDTTSLFLVVGPHASSALKELTPETALATSGRCLSIQSPPSTVAPFTGLGLPGFMVVTEAKEEVWARLTSSGKGQKGGMEEWQVLRIVQGRPYPDQELTEEVTPLEAGLWHTVHLDKGCYLGQETITKVARNSGERQKLYGVVFPQPVPAGTRLTSLEDEGKRAGVVTSMVESGPVKGAWRGLAYVRKGMGAPGSKVRAGDVVGEVVEVRYATRTEEEAAAPFARASGSEGDSQGEDAKAKEEERKAKKLEEMRKKVEAFKAKQQANKAK